MTTAHRTTLGTASVLAVLAFLALLLSTCGLPSAAGDGTTLATPAADRDPAGATATEPPPVDDPEPEGAADAEGTGDEGVGPSEPGATDVGSDADEVEPSGASEGTAAGESDAGGLVDTATDVADTTQAADLDDPTEAAPPEPTRVVVPRIGVDNPLVEVGLHPDRSLVVPDEAHVAGWYTGRPRPGEPGPSIVTGHNQWKGSLGVFYRLHQLAPGDVIEIHHDDGSVVRFEIERLEQHPKDDFPTQRVYGPTDRAEIRVITCGGHFDRSRRSHVDNVIAFGVRVE